MDREMFSSISVDIKPLIESDISHLEPILKEHVRDSDTNNLIMEEISRIKDYMRGKRDEGGRIRTYFVAKNDKGSVLGCMAYSDPDPDMLRHFRTTPAESAELLNAFVSGEIFRGGGVGKKLFSAICEAMKKEGKKYLILNSGTRYKLSWGFYDKVCNENFGFIKDKFGKGRDAKTWRKTL
jgi:hypothetical protein